MKIDYDGIFILCAMLLLTCVLIFASVGIYTDHKNRKMLHEQQMENYKIQMEIYKCKLQEDKNNLDKR